MMSELLLGCGVSRKKKIYLDGKVDFENLTTLDIDPEVSPDVVHDLNVLPYPFEDNTFDEIHAYEVLEHFGTQGDYKGFFKQFEELHRILKPNGRLIATVPIWNGLWAWGDPGHTRVINRGTLMFLDQDNYGKPPMTDYRAIYKGNFAIEGLEETENHMIFVLRKKC